jgi:hypothetical protein
MLCEYKRVLDFWIGFIEPLDTARDYILQVAVTHTHTHPRALVSTATSSLDVAR